MCHIVHQNNTDKTLRTNLAIFQVQNLKCPIIFFTTAFLDHFPLNNFLSNMVDNSPVVQEKMIKMQKCCARQMDKHTGRHTDRC